MNRLPLFTLSGMLVAMSLQGATRDKEAKIHRPSLQESVQISASVYLCSVEVSGGLPRLFVKEIWRHDSKFGHSLAHGDEILPRQRKSFGEGRPEAVIVFVEAPSKDSIMKVHRITPVYQGKVPALGMSVAQAAKIIVPK